MRGAALILAEARGIRVADEAFAKRSFGTTPGVEEREAWLHLVEGAHDRILTYEDKRRTP